MLREMRASYHVDKQYYVTIRADIWPCRTQQSAILRMHKWRIGESSRVDASGDSRQTDSYSRNMYHPLHAYAMALRAMQIDTYAYSDIHVK